MGVSLRVVPSAISLGHAIRILLGRAWAPLRYASATQAKYRLPWHKATATVTHAKPSDNIIERGGKERLQK